METWVIAVNEIKYEDRCELRGHLEAAMASEATKMDESGNSNTENWSFKIEIVENHLDSFSHRSQVWRAIALLLASL